MLIRPSTHSRGFTLIELLVVIFIASLMAGLVVINISFESSEDKIQQQAKRLHALLNFAHEQSIIRAEEYGLRFHQTGYRFMVLQDDVWSDLDNDRHLNTTEFKHDIEIELFIEESSITLNTADEEAELIREQQSKDDEAAADDNEDDEEDKDENENDNDKLKPQIFLLSSGELTPAFSSRIRIPGMDTYFDVEGTLNGEYKLIDPETDE